jgi:hypothetical protein
VGSSPHQVVIVRVCFTICGSVYVSSFLEKWVFSLVIRGPSWLSPTLGDIKVITPIHPPLGDIKVLSRGNFKRNY